MDTFLCTLYMFYVVRCFTKYVVVMSFHPFLSHWGVFKGVPSTYRYA